MSAKMEFKINLDCRVFFNMHRQKCAGIFTFFLLCNMALMPRNRSHNKAGVHAWLQWLSVKIAPLLSLMNTGYMDVRCKSAEIVHCECMVKSPRWSKLMRPPPLLLLFLHGSGESGHNETLNSVQNNNYNKVTSNNITQIMHISFSNRNPCRWSNTWIASSLWKVIIFTWNRKERKWK